MLVEIGGTVGDIEGLPFFEAIRQLGQELPRGHACYIHLTLLPFIKTAGEMKTKPTQHSVQGAALHRHPARHPAVPLRTADPGRASGARSACSATCATERGDPGDGFSANIYAVPLDYHAQGLDAEVLDVFGIETTPRPRTCALAGDLRAPEPSRTAR